MEKIVFFKIDEIHLNELTLREHYYLERLLKHMLIERIKNFLLKSYFDNILFYYNYKTLIYDYTEIEQCEIAEPIYNKLFLTVVNKFELELQHMNHDIELDLNYILENNRSMLLTLRKAVNVNIGLIRRNTLFLSYELINPIGE